MGRWILHVDMDAFFASVEQRDHPEYRGKPVIVGGLGARGVVSTASYEARRFGVHSAMSMHEARRLCPQAVFLVPDIYHYQAVSQAIHKIFRAFSPLIEPLSLDEAFLDISGMQLLFTSPVALAKQLKATIRAELNLVASVGLAPNKFLAKIASDMQKPDGLQVIEYGKEAATISPLSVDKIWGVGKVTLPQLRQLGLFTIGDVAKAELALLEQTFGIFGREMQQLARGIDVRPVLVQQAAQSIGRETTFEQDWVDEEAILTHLFALTEQVGWKLRQAGLGARRVTLKIRYPSFETVTRSKTLSQVISLDDDIFQVGQALFLALPRREPIRLLGISVSHLLSTSQLSLFEAEESKKSKLSVVTDELKRKFGQKIVTRGRLVTNKESRHKS
ncbi:DNA polymerase-4 [Sporomusaceae bacterium BoRhaA]|uniref:DNA polymerase IV n=1 Tax=Pelorhabdus rhamnosifermentans TaxID=2772457 RepID=UPI001C0613FF|nr:DNA polymerase IV [Pelorhabdus rhamnosifermentans]MBU2700539.1 DNA polymerase-4 [Pelorhabdus rhamnosifermentans]